MNTWSPRRIVVIVTFDNGYRSFKSVEPSSQLGQTLLKKWWGLGLTPSITSEVEGSQGLSGAFGVSPK